MVDELKSTGMAPEHVILAIKGIASDAKMGPGGQSLIEQMVTWCLKQYFGTKQPKPTTRG